jgi:hypothetical protein
MKAGKPKTVTMPKSMPTLGVPKQAKPVASPMMAKAPKAPTFAAKAAKALGIGKKFSR